MRYRFAWTFPIVFSPHDATSSTRAATTCSARRDEGMSWEEISPDFSLNDKIASGSFRRRHHA